MKTDRPDLRFLSSFQVQSALADAHRILAEVGVEVELSAARERLIEAGASADEAGRIRLPARLIEDALGSVPAQIKLFDRSGEEACVLGRGEPHYCPGSAAIRVLDWGSPEMRPSTLEDCVAFARLTEALPAFDLQSTCVVPTELPVLEGDRQRLAMALLHCTKPIITGTFVSASFEPMIDMLAVVRGGRAALAAKPLAIFDCCPTAPLSWSELTTTSLVGCAETGVPAEIISVPMTGATAPMSLRGSIAQHAAECLSGVVIHQLFAPGAPVIWGTCASGFDMRNGTSPMGAVESMLLNASVAQVGRHLGLPTHGFYALSDSKALDYQAGYESGCGALVAALAQVDVVTGPGILEFVGCQSLEKLVLDHEVCLSARRAVAGVTHREEEDVVDLVEQGIASGQFLNLRHTRKTFREELLFPGPTVDRQDGTTWLLSGGSQAHQTAHKEVERLLAGDGAAPLEQGVVDEIDRLRG